MLRYVMRMGPFLFVLVLATGTPARANKCTGAKFKAAGKAAGATLKCDAKADGSGLSLVPFCSLKAGGVLGITFQKTDLSGSCPGTVCNFRDGLLPTFEAVANVAVGNAGSPRTASKCDATKVGAMGKKAAGILACYSKAAAKDLMVDPGCLSGPEAKYGLAIDKAVAAADCSIVGDQHDALEARVDEFVTAAIAELTSNGVPICTVLTSWGSAGSADGQFVFPIGVATDASGNVYVADQGNYRIQKFDTTGTFLTKWGSFGSADGQFDHLTNVATDASGHVYVADGNNERIQKFDASGTFLTKWGSIGSADGQFYDPEGVATDTSGNVYVADNFNFRIQKFDASGTFLTKWGSFGSADGQFVSARGVATDASGNVYVADGDNSRISRIQKFDATGAFLAKWGSRGCADGQFAYPEGVATDASGNVYVADNGNGIQKFDASGTLLAKGAAAGFGVATDTSGNVYVAEYGAHRIQKFACP